MLRIKVVDVPDGEEPLWVREQFVGIVVSARSVSRATTLRCCGVVSGWPDPTDPYDGYAVKVHEIVQALKPTSPGAAAWYERWAQGPIGVTTMELLLSKRVTEIA